MKRRVSFAVAGAALMALMGTAMAALLGVHLTFPLISYQNTSPNALSYSATTKLFSIDATPSAILFASNEVHFVTGGTLTIRLFVDNSGALVGGIPGDDLVLTGTVMRGTNIYTGILLTGEVTGFGFLESGATDQYDLRFTPTGGALLSYFSCGNIGVQVSSEGSTFNNSFSVNFNGRAKGNIGLEDLTPPTITCPFADTGGTNVVECQAHSGGLPGAFVSYPMPSVTDNCDTNPTVTCTPPSGSFFPLSPTDQMTNYTVTCVVTDASGNSNSCTFVIKVQDTLPPEFADTNNPIINPCDLTHPITLTNDPGHCYATFTFMMPMATDNCCPSNIPVQVSAVDENGANIPLTDAGEEMLQGQFPVTMKGSNVITITASDGRGNSAQHQCAVVVLDTEPPDITCTNQTVECTGGPIYYDDPIVTDNCPCVKSSCTPPSGSVLTVGPHAIVCTAADCSGNTNQCTFFVIVQDTTPPMIHCPTNVTVQCGQSTDPTNTGVAMVNDRCDSNPKVNHTDASAGNCPEVISRTWTATDSSGNTNSCVQMITIQDTNPPSINCPSAITVQCFGDIPASDPATVHGKDGCSTPVMSFVSDALVTNGCVITVTRTYKAADACSNSATCTQTITVQDTNKPSITCPPPVTVQCFGNIPAPDTNSVTASDTCGAVSKKFVGDTYATNGCVITVTRTYKATDACSNYKTCTQTITVQDTNKPSITCPPPVTVQCFGNIPAPDTNSVTASDTCSAVSKKFVGDSYGTNGCVITVTRTYKATDACSNYATCTQAITVQDTNKPTIKCPGNIAAATASNQCTAIVNYTVTNSDNCGVVSLICTPPPGSAFPQGTTTVTCTAKDACSNSATCSFTVTVYSPTNTLPPPNALPACDTSQNTLTGPAGFATYSWSIIASTGPNWAITSGTNSQTVTYTAGSSGSATFQLAVTTASGCKFVYQVTFACNAGGSTPGFWGNKNGLALLTSSDFSALTALCLRDGDGSDRDFKSKQISQNRSDLDVWLANRTAVNMSYMFSAHLAAMKLNVLHGFASASNVVPIGGCGNLNNGNSIAIGDLITLSNSALCNDGYTPAQDPNRTLQECYKNALANANAATVHP